LTYHSFSTVEVILTGQRTYRQVLWLAFMTSVKDFWSQVS